MPVDKRESRLELTAVDKASAVIGQVKNSVDGLRSSLDSMKGALEAVGVVVGIGATAKLLADLIKAQAAFADLSAQTGASVENLSKLSAIAKIGGRDFDGFTDQLARMVKGLKSGNDEGQLASRALAFLGVSAKDANGVFRDTGQIAFDVAKALSKYADDGNKVALVQDALGKGAQRYIPLLKDMVQFGDTVAGTTAEQALKSKEFEESLNRLAAASAAASRSLANDLLPTLSQVAEKFVAIRQAQGGGFIGFMAKLGIGGDQADDPIKAVEELNQKLEDLRRTRAALETPDSTGFFGQFAQLQRLFNSDDVAILGQQISYAEKQRQVLEILAKAQRARQAQDPSSPFFEFGGGGMSSGYQSPDLGREQSELKLYTHALQQLEEELGKLNQMSKADLVINRLTHGSWQGIKDVEHQAALISAAGEYDDKQVRLAGQKLFVESLEQQVHIMEQAKQASIDYADANQRQLDQMGFETSLILMSAAAREKAIAVQQVDLGLRAALGRLPRDTEGQLLPGAQASAQLMIAAAEAQKQAVARSVDERIRLERSWAVGTKGAFDEYASNATNAALQARMVFGNAFQNMEDALVAFARTGKLNFRNFADSLINDILRIQTRMYITGPLAQMGSDLFSSALPALGAGVGSLFGFANGGVMSSGGSAPLTRYASGGVATSPQLAMFGEGATPEAFVPLPDGRSIPVQMRGGMSGGTNYYILPVVSGDSYSDVHAALRSIDSNFDSRAIAAVYKAAQSRGKRLF
jgi:lambda family phage tail tape measure protein